MVRKRQQLIDMAIDVGRKATWYRPANALVKPLSLAVANKVWVWRRSVRRTVSRQTASSSLVAPRPSCGSIGPPAVLFRCRDRADADTAPAPPLHLSFTQVL